MTARTYLLTRDLTPAKKLAVLCEAFGIRTAWHGPDDTSPVGHAANLHLDVNSPSFGIQEWSGFNEPLQEVFPGCPQVRKGYIYPNEEQCDKYPYRKYARDRRALCSEDSVG